MKAKSRRRTLSSILVMLLVASMIATSAWTGFFKPTVNAQQNGVESSTSEDSYITKHLTSGDANIAENLSDEVKAMNENNNNLSDNDRVSYIIRYDDNSLFNMYENDSKTTESYSDYINTRTARVNAENMISKHTALFSRIARKIDAKFHLSYTGIVNGFAVEIKYGDRKALEEIVKSSGGLDITISERYAMPQYEIVTNEVAVDTTGIFDTAGIEYDGTGKVIAVLDTGIDYEHPAFKRENLPLKKDAQGNVLVDSNGKVIIDEEKLALTYSDIDSLIKSKALLSTTGFVNAEGIYEQFTTSLNTREVYMSEKIPYAYDYTDKDTNVSSGEENAHGTHVAGIVAGQSVESDIDPEKIDAQTKEKYKPMRGVAPLAQIAVMKVFSDYRNGADDYSLIAALNDCVALDVDVINMSLGLGSGFSDQKESPVLQKAYEAVGEAGISLIVSAGNGYSSGRGGHYGTNLLANPDSATVSSPSTMYQSFSVASIEGAPSKFLLARNSSGNESVAYFTESGKANGDRYEFIKDLKAYINNPDYIREWGDYRHYITTDAEGNEVMDIPYQVVPGLGEGVDYSGINVQGKIAVIKRGNTTFTQKLELARDKGAIAGIVYNNVSGLISMSLEDKTKIPAASITMDAADAFISIRQGTFHIDERQGAGPFMSDFSSWGPTPSLELKPEITGHGGEIYSAYPGNNYSRISGTSMSAPNIAGLTILSRQYVEDYSDIFELPNRNAGETAQEKRQSEVKYRNSVEDMVYLLMMSTATIPKNEEGNPYSPRRIGAGLANIHGLVKTPSYLFVKDAEGNRKDRAKIELFDDVYRQQQIDAENELIKAENESLPAGQKKPLKEFKKGVFDMTFYVKNFSENAASYTLSAVAMTESVATDGITVAEKAYMLNNGTKTWMVDNVPVDANSVITVEPGEETRIDLRLSLAQSEMNYIEKTFVNGHYVEGFVTLTSTSVGEDGKANGVDLNIPYLSFYGDWSKAPITDYDIYTEDADDKSSKKEAEKRYSQGRALMAFGKLIENGNDYTMPMGQLIFSYPDEYRYSLPVATMGQTTISFNDQSLSGLFYVSGFLRGCKTVNWKITDKITGDLLSSGTNTNVRKDAKQSNIGGIKIEKSAAELGLANNGLYTFSFEGFLDYNNGEGSNSNTWSFDFSVDTSSPMIVGAEIRTERNNATGTYRKFVDFNIYDDNYLQAMSFDIWDEVRNDYVSIWDKGLRPLLSSKNSTTRVTYDLTDLWETLKRANYKIRTRVYDYALNFSYYEIDLSKVLYKNAQQIYFVNNGVFSEYTSKYDANNKTTVMTSFQEELDDFVETDFPVLPDTIQVRQYSSFNLKNAIYTVPNEVWEEEIVWESSDPLSVDVDPKTGLVFAKEAGGMATITARSASNPAVFASVNVIVLTNEECEEFGISKLDPNITRFSGIELFGESRLLYAGESYTISARSLPFYNTSDNLVVEWTNSNQSVSTIQVDPNDPYKVTITASQGKYLDAEGNEVGKYKDEEGNEKIDESMYRYAAKYVSNDYSGVSSIMVKITDTVTRRTYNKQIRIQVRKEFVVEAAELKEYNGTRANVTIPHDLDIKNIGYNVFSERNDIISVFVPEKVEKIGYAAFAYMEKLEKVELPSTIKMIDEWAFAGKVTPDGLFSTSLKYVDTSKFKEAVQVGTRAFVAQIMLGSNMTTDGITYRYDINEGMRSIDCLLDFSKFRVIGNFAFAFTYQLHNVDLSGCRAMGISAFSYSGQQAAQFASGFYSSSGYEPPMPNFNYMTLTTSLDTAIGTEAFTYSGIGTLTYNARRVVSTAFLRNQYLTKLTFTADDLVVETGAFSGTTNINSIRFNGSVDYIGDVAFYDVSNDPNETPYVALEDVTFAKGCRYIGNAAFASIPSMKQFTIPSGLEYMGEMAFAGCTSLEKLILPDDFGDNGNDFKLINSFFGEEDAVKPKNFKRIEVSEANKHFMAQEIEGTDSNMLFTKDGKELVFVPFAAELESYVVPEGVEKIREYAFGANIVLKDIDLGNVSEVGEGALAHCINLENVVYSPNLVNVPDYMFYDCGSLRTVTGLENVETVGYAGFYGTIVNSLSFPRATSFGNFAFSNISYSSKDENDTYTALTYFEIPTGVTELAAALFEGCQNLTTVKFHNKLTKIGSQVFTDCINLTTIQGSTYEIREIGALAFQNTLLSEITFENVKTVGAYAFSNDANKGLLTEVRLSNVLQIGEGAFMGNKDITRISLPLVEYIGPYAFTETKVTTEALDIKNAKVIDSCAFLNVETLVGTLVIPKNVSYIGTYAFYGTNIQNYAVASGNQYFEAIDGVLFRRVETGLELFAYPTGDRGVANYVIPEGTIRIKEYAFESVDTLRSVTMPASLKSIGHMAFYGTTDLYTFTFLSLSAPILESYADSISKQLTGDQYSYFWANYANFVGYYSMNSFMYNMMTEEIFTQAPYIYNTITPQYYTDTFSYINSSLQGGRSVYTYGLIMVRPRNGSGYTDFIYSNYFDVAMIAGDTIESNTQSVFDRIEALPLSNEINRNNLADVVSVYSDYNKLSDSQRILITNYSKLENALNTVKSYNNGSLEYTATLMVDGEVSGTLNVLIGQPIPFPSLSIRDGFQFDGWYIGDEKYDGSMGISGDQTFVARWHNLLRTDTIDGVKVPVYEKVVSIVYSGMGVNIPAQLLVTGRTPTKPANPTKDGFNFVGWFIENEGVPFNFEQPVTEDVELTAMWQDVNSSNANTVVFIDNNRVIKTEVYDNGEKLVLPENPSKDGYKFKGWQYDEREVNTDTVVTSDMVIVATWEKEGCGSGTINGTLTTLLVLLAVFAVFAVGITVMKKKRAMSS